MNIVSEKTLKTKFAKGDIIVFCTSKTLNERFTPKEPRCVFVINNGFTAPYKNNAVKERIVMENRLVMKIHRRFSQYQRANAVKSKERAKQMKGGKKLKDKLNKLANRRRVVLMPTKVTNETLPVISPKAEFENSKIWPTNSSNADIRTAVSSNVAGQSVRQWIRKAAKRSSDSGLQVEPTNDFINSEGSEITVHSEFVNKNSRYNPQPYTWKRRPSTKVELDEELDNYMSEIKFKTQTPVAEDVDSFVQEYMMETEKFLNQSENEDDTMIF